MTAVSASKTCDLTGAHVGVNSPTSSGAVSHAVCKAECIAKGRWTGGDTEFKLMDKAIDAAKTTVCLGVSWTTSGTLCKLIHGALLAAAVTAVTGKCDKRAGSVLPASKGGWTLFEQNVTYSANTSINTNGSAGATNK